MISSPAYQKLLQMSLQIVVKSIEGIAFFYSTSTGLVWLWPLCSLEIEFYNFYSSLNLVYKLNFIILLGVRLGEWDTATAVDCDESFTDGTVCNDPPVDIPVELKIPHENYDPHGSNQHNDIALLRLSQEVRFSTFIRPICLPVEPTIRNNLFEKQTLSVAGWGELLLRYIKDFT